MSEDTPEPTETRIPASSIIDEISKLRLAIETHTSTMVDLSTLLINSLENVSLPTAKEENVLPKSGNIPEVPSKSVSTRSSTVINTTPVSKTNGIDMSNLTPTQREALEKARTKASAPPSRTSGLDEGSWLNDPKPMKPSDLG